MADSTASPVTPEQHVFATGAFILRHYPDGSIWIERRDVDRRGEGMQVSVAAFDEALNDFFNGMF